MASCAPGLCNTAKCCTTRQCDIRQKVERLTASAQNDAPDLSRRKRYALYWLTYCGKSFFRTSLSIARFARDRYSPVGVTSRQQVGEADGFRSTSRLIERAGVAAGSTFKAHAHMLRYAEASPSPIAGRDTRSLQAYVGRSNIRHARSATPSYAGPVQGFLAVADMGISQRKLRAIRVARAVRMARADARAADLAAIVTELRAAGASLQAIAASLNERGIPTARGVGEWRAGEVRRVLARLPHCRAVRVARAETRVAIAQLRAAGASLQAIADSLNERGIPTATGVGEWGAAQVWRVLARLPRCPN
jgi:Recombinase